tara:strand:+ start:2769 stop:3140 length:372 start_codon:yes stop_codon:yes gene_type:complete
LFILNFFFALGLKLGIITYINNIQLIFIFKINKSNISFNQKNDYLIDFYMDVELNVDTNEMKIDCILLQKMIFIYNALEKGWTVKKRKDKYVFSKSHKGKKEVLLDDYLKRFMVENLDINKII